MALRTFNRTIELMILIAGAIFMIQNPVNYAMLAAFIAIQIVRLLDKQYDWRFPEWYYSFFIFSIVINFLGENVIGLYYVIPHFDKILHFVVPLGLAFITYDLVKIKGISVFVVMGMVAIFELLEYLFDIFLGTSMQGVFVQGVLLMDPLTDTMLDILFGLAGSVVGLLLKSSYVYYLAQTQWDCTTCQHIGRQVQYCAKHSLLGNMPEPVNISQRHFPERYRSRR